MTTKGGPPPPTWDVFLRALVSMREQGFDLIQIVTACPGDGFETVIATIRKPAEVTRA